MQKRSLLVQVLLDMATGGGAKLEALLVDRAGTFDAGLNKGYNPVTVPSGNVNIYGEKGTVENHSVVVTPKAQLSGGWLNTGEVEGAGVGVTAGELVDGTYNVSRAGIADVTNYKDVSVNAGGTTSYLERTAIGEHSVRLTPKADVTGGWQDNKTVTGDSIDVDASGLVSGTYPVTASGEFDVTTYEKISVPSGVVDARAIKGVVANHSVLITPSATRTAGFISSGETAGQDVRVDASELVSGSLAVTANGTYDVTNYKYVEVNMSNRELIYNGTFTARGLMGTLNNCLSWAGKYYGLMFHYKLNSFGSGLGSVSVGLSTTTTDIDQWGTGFNSWGVEHFQLSVGAEIWHPCTFSKLNTAYINILDPSGNSQYKLRINDTMYVMCMCAQGYAVRGTIEIYGLLI